MKKGFHLKLTRWISKLSNRVDIPVFGTSFLSDLIKILRDQPKRMLPAGWTDRQSANIPGKREIETVLRAVWFRLTWNLHAVLSNVNISAVY